MLIILWIIFCIIAGAAASNRGRSGFGYFLLSLILSPIIVFIIILVLGENKHTRRERIYEDAKTRENVAQNYVLVNNFITYNDTKKCPFCAEKIKIEAIVCRFCGKELPKGNDNVLDVNITSEVNYAQKRTIPSITPIVNYGDTWICKKCGEKNPITSITCKDCGEYK